MLAMTPLPSPDAVPPWSVNWPSLGKSTAVVPLAYMNQVHGGGCCRAGPPEQTAAVRSATCPRRTPWFRRTGPWPSWWPTASPLSWWVKAAGGAPVLAVAHAGRPGVERGVMAAVVARMRAAGAEGIEAWLGPSVCGQCYEVPEAMRAAVAAVVPQAHATTSLGHAGPGPACRRAGATCRRRGPSPPGRRVHPGRPAVLLPPPRHSRRRSRGTVHRLCHCRCRATCPKQPRK